MTIQYIDSGFHPVKDIWFKDPSIGDVPIRAVNSGNTRIWTRGVRLIEDFKYGSTGFLTERPNTLWREGENTNSSRSRMYLVSDGEVRASANSNDGTYDSRVWMKKAFKNYDVKAEIWLGSAPNTPRGVSLYVGNPNASSYEIALANNELQVKRYKEGETTGSWATFDIEQKPIYQFILERKYHSETADFITVRQVTARSSSSTSTRILYEAYLGRNEKISTSARYISDAYNYVGIRSRFRRAYFTNYAPPAITCVVVDDR